VGVSVRIAAIGLGYVGLVTSACLAEWGHDVDGFEASDSRLSDLRSGRVPFYEPGLETLLARNTEAGRLSFLGTDQLRRTAEADVVFVAVGTHDGNGGWQTATILSSLSSLVPLLADDAVLVIRSTLPPDFVAQLGPLIQMVRHEAGRPTIAVVLNPEFTKEGNAVADFMRPERVVLGVINDPENRGVSRLIELYERASAPVLVMPAMDAAFSKLAANLFLATKISFANELAGLCESYGANIDTVVQAMSYDPRIGGRFLHAGVGFGGSCLPNQVAMMVRAASDTGTPVPLLSAVDEINHGQRLRFVERLAAMLGGELAGRRIALLGLTFKPMTDDVRDAPALTIARLLVERHARPIAYDPMPRAREAAATLIDGLEVTDSVDTALHDADAIALVTEWPEFREIDWRRAAQLVAQPIVLDGRNALPGPLLVEAGFTYAAFGRGRPPVQPAAAIESLAPPGDAARIVGAEPLTNGDRLHALEPSIVIGPARS
jgi:UDPglucose 6-dehydrogenase